jgi:gas vesicle protein
VKFILGFAIGVALGLISAPARGEQTRQKLAQKIRDLRGMPARKAEEFAETAKEKAGEVGGRIGRQAAEAAVEAVRHEVLGESAS